jgi:hypothetical protein
MRFRLGTLPVLACLLASPALPQSAAQGVTMPGYSPYLNLLRAGAPPGFNYYGLVRPEVQWRTAVGQLQQQTAFNRQEIADVEATAAIPPTGVVAGFQTQTVYFNNVGTQGGPAGFGAVAARPGVAGGPGGQLGGAPPRATGGGRR